MSKRRILGLTVAALIAAACAAPRTQPRPASPEVAPASGPRLPVVPMDSATIERLCAKPDSVRAGTAECVLKDQSPPAPPIRRTSPPPP